MTNEEVIARQAKELYELRDQVARLKENASNARMFIYGCGGPLNDNVDGYSREQMVTFQRIADELGE
jgi:hypothetical protein